MAGKGKGKAGRGKRASYQAKEKRRVDINSMASNAGVRKLARRAGVKRITKLVYYEAKGNMHKFVEEAVRRALIFCDSARRKTILSKDVFAALKGMGHTMVG